MTNDTCYILALIKRDDGERMLLGSGYYQFTAEQKHFAPNIFANDVVELQGTDGQLLAGQVRRSASQNFDGYIGDGTVAKTTVEQKRRDFFLFFRKQHHYTVVYIMPDGTAIKRDRGYITDAPAVQELYQLQPKWHIALAFEDVNYYSYAEDAAGNEVYSYSADLTLAAIETGGLVWDANGAISEAYKLSLVDIKGDTFQQSYEGKNLFDKTTAKIAGGYISGAHVVSGYQDPITNQRDRLAIVPCLPNTTYTITKPATPVLSKNRFRIGTSADAPANGSTLNDYWNAGDGAATTTRTFTTSSTANWLCIFYGQTEDYGASDILQTVLDGIQLELGSTATSYEPFVGGKASPSPDYPQPIQTVTGTQTITVNGTNYTINLGTIELNELGTYRDRIYKDGASWKLRKETASYTFDGTEPWTYDDVRIPRSYLTSVGLGTLGIHPAIPASSSVMPIGITNRFVGKTFAAFYTNSEGNGFAMSTSGRNFQIGDNSWTSSADAIAAATGTKWTYALATGYATDTTITDAGLIAQLDAVEAAIAESTTTPTVTASSPNLPAILGLAPNGDTGGYIFDANSGGGPVNVTVNGVDSATPVWHVYGPCTNPTLTNSTTGEALTWNSTVPSGQELIIDMGAQTATLEGANVFEFVSGSWVTMQPGINRISYTAGNTTDGSRIYWNEVVG